MRLEDFSCMGTMPLPKISILREGHHVMLLSHLLQVSCILDDAVHTLGEELFVLVVNGHDDEEFGMMGRVIMDLAEGTIVVLEVEESKAAAE